MTKKTKRRVRIGLVFIASLLLASCSSESAPNSRMSELVKEANVALEEGRIEDSRNLLTAAGELPKQLTGEQSDKRKVLSSAIKTHIALAARLQELGDNATAKRVLERAVEIEETDPLWRTDGGPASASYKRLLETHEEEETILSEKAKASNKHRETLEKLKRSGEDLIKQKKFKDAIVVLHQAEQLCRAGTVDMAEVQFRLAGAYGGLKDNKKAIEELQKACNTFEKKSTTTRKLCQAEGRLGIFLQDDGKVDEASVYFNRVLAIIDEFPDDVGNQTHIIGRAALNSWKRGDKVEAKLREKRFEEAFAKDPCEESVRFAYYVSVGDILQDAKQFKQSKGYYKRALNGRPKRPPDQEERHFIGNCYMRLAACESALQEYDQAARDALRAVPLIDPKIGVSLASTLNGIANGYSSKHRFNKSAELQEVSVKLCEAQSGKSSTPAVSTMIQMSDSYWLLGNPEKSRLLLREARARLKHMSREAQSDYVPGIELRVKQRSFKLD